MTKLNMYTIDDYGVAFGTEESIASKDFENPEDAWKTGVNWLLSASPREGTFTFNATEKWGYYEDAKGLFENRWFSIR